MSQRYTILNSAKDEATAIVAAASTQAAADAHTGGDATRVLDWPGWVLRDIVIISGPAQKHRQVWEAEQLFGDLIVKLERGTINRGEWFSLFRILGTYRGSELIASVANTLKLTSDKTTMLADGITVATYTIDIVDRDDASVGAGTDTVEIEVSAPCNVSAVSVVLVAGTKTFTITSQNGIRGTLDVRVKVADDSLNRSEPLRLALT